MSQTLKLKFQNEKFSKKIPVPSNLNELIEKIQLFYQNNDPQKIYQVYDEKLNKIIQNQNDYQIFKLQHASERNMILFISLIDKNNNINKIPDYQLENSSICFESIVVEKKKEEIEEKEKSIKKDLTEEEKIKESIRSLVRSKLKFFKDNIINEIRESSQPIHKGIKCNGCGINDIKGIRYKCSICLDYNLCEKCEEDTEHDENHYFLKITQPVSSEDNLNQKIYASKINLSKAMNDNNNYDFIVDPIIFQFKENNLINYQTIKFTNSGNISFKKGFIFKCIKEKNNLIGNDYYFKEEVNPGKSIDIELIFDSDQQEGIIERKEIFAFYKLIDDKYNQIGNIQKFIIEISN